ncbi:hypothetical protein Hanom_Chr16g01450591 [Helianthus anomalus]
MTFSHSISDVIGYVTEVGAPSVNASGSRTVEFSLTNERKRQVRVTLWGHLGDVMIKRKSENPPIYSLILTSMSAKFYLGTFAPCVCPAQHRLCSSIQTRYLCSSLSGRPSGIIIASTNYPLLSYVALFCALPDYLYAFPSCVAVDGTSEPITEDVACVATLSELLDKVRGDKTKKKVRY